MPPETMNDLFAFLTNLMTTHAAMFQALGLNLFRALAIILIVWFGVKSALASASGGSGFQLDQFAALLMTISFGFAMITFYDRPLPGMGVSFYHHCCPEKLPERACKACRFSVMHAVWR